MRVLQRYAGPGMGMQFIPRIVQEVLVNFFDGDLDRPYVLGALYSGRGEGGTPAAPGGKGAESATTAFAQSNDFRPSATQPHSAASRPRSSAARALTIKDRSREAAI